MNDADKGTPKYSKNDLCHIVHQNYHQDQPVLNPGLHGDGSGTNQLNHSMVSPEFHFKNSDTAHPEYYFTDNNMYKLQKNTPSSENTPHLKTIVGPRSKLHDATLLIKRKILNIDLTGGLVDSWRFPGNISFECDNRLCHQSHLIVSVRATNKQTPV